MALVPSDPHPKLGRIAMNPPHDRGRIHFHAALLHPLRQARVADPAFTVPVNADQEDRNGKTTMLEPKLTS